MLRASSLIPLKLASRRPEFILISLIAIFITASLSPNNIVTEYVRQFNCFAVAQGAALQLVGQIRNAGAPAMDHCQRPAPGSQRRFVSFGTLMSSHTSPRNISISDGHAVVEVRRYYYMAYHTKIFRTFPYIQEVGNPA